MGSINCLVTGILQNIFLCVREKKELNVGLKQHEGEKMIRIWVNYSFKT